MEQITNFKRKMRPPNDPCYSQNQNFFIKPSLSLTSLPPQSPQDNQDMAQQRARLDRPYNSLKKKRDADKEIWRRSWGSGHSHSSCSLQSSVTNTAGYGKDDFWAALSTNYNFIMDTNLLDCCKEVNVEVNADGANLRMDEANCCRKAMLQLKKQTFPDLRGLRQWIKEMENAMSKIPSITETRKLKTDELLRLSAEQTELYREIVSKNRVVAACIKSFSTDKKVTSNSGNSADDSSNVENNATATKTTKKENIGKSLEKRYHLLYLKAIEIQCLLESLLEKASSSDNASLTDTDTNDEEPVKKVARLSECDITQENDHKSKNFNKEWVKQKTSDTCSSDCEIVPKIIKYNFSKSDQIDSPISNDPIMESNQNVPSITSAEIINSVNNVQETKLNHNSNNSNNNNKSKSTKSADLSKFNRSNRKSKNCATFYFKHADTDTEANKGSNKDQIDKSDESSSENDEWVFTNNNSNQINEDVLAEEGNTMDTVIENDIKSNNSLPKTRTSKKCLNFFNETCLKIETGENLKSDSMPPEKPVDKNDEEKCTAVIQTPKQSTTKSIKKLVLHAESLVREENFAKSPKTVIKNNHHNKKIEKTMNSIRKYRIEEWLDKQPAQLTKNNKVESLPNTDCEASDEYTDSDSFTRETDSVATCLQHDQTSQEMSDIIIYPSERIASTDEIDAVKVVTEVKRRINKPTADRPWSISCISQINSQNIEQYNVEIGDSPLLSNFSISESALNTISSIKTIKTMHSEKSYESKSSLKKRKLKLRRKSRTVAEELLTVTKKSSKNNSLSKMTEDINNGAMTTSSLSGSSRRSSRQHKSERSSNDSEEEQQENATLTKPIFRIGSLTRPARCGSVNLGSLAKLANYNLDTTAKCENDLNGTVTEEAQSSFSEQAWDNYQEKYMSEAYSEERDTDAARRLLDFGDDYRNFMDSQSDCCSSLSAQNVDSLSPPRFRRSEVQPKVDNYAKTNSLHRKKKMDEWNDSNKYCWTEKATPSICNTSSLERSKNQIFDGEYANLRRRSVSKNMSSSSNDELEEDTEAEFDKLLLQTKTRLENTETLKIKQHLLKAEDYAELITTCKENIRCLEAVLKCQAGSILSATKCQTIRDLVISWEKLLNWSERRIIVNQFRNETIELKAIIDEWGVKDYTFKTDTEIQNAVDDLKLERKLLHTQRSKMLTLNATVHNWITNQELSHKDLLLIHNKSHIVNKENCTCLNDIEMESDVYIDLKDGIVELYKSWDDCELRIKGNIDNLSTSLMTWRQIENDLTEFKSSLDKDRGTLHKIEDALQQQKTEELLCNIKNAAQLFAEKSEIIINQQSLKISSSGSLSDSGISDGGLSDGSFSEREKRLNALKRLIKQLEMTLAPGCDVVRSIYKRLEMAEIELRTLQNTCRKIIMKEATLDENDKTTNESLPKIRSKSRKNGAKKESKSQTTLKKADDSTGKIKGKKFSQKDEDNEKGEKESPKSRWMWRITQIAIPVQVALILVICAACFLEPHCCDALNTYTMSFTPQLRYIKGPPPI